MKHKQNRYFRNLFLGTAESRAVSKYSDIFRGITWKPLAGKNHEGDKQAIHYKDEDTRGGNQQG
jgi:hypothetical protein